MNFHRATIWVGDLVENMIENGQLQMDSSTFAGELKWVLPGIELVDGFWLIDESIAIHLCMLAKEHYQFFDACCEIVAHNIRGQSPLPESLRFFAAAVLDGKLKRPTPPHRPRKANWEEIQFLHSLVLTVSRYFELPATRNDASPKHSACDAVAEALSVCGRPTRYSELKALITSPDFATARREFDAYIKLLEWKSPMTGQTNILRVRTHSQ